MRPAGPEKGIGIISAAYLKEPTDPQWQNTPEYKEWLAWMKKYNTSANVADINNVAGYSYTQTMVAVLKACGDNLTRENVMKQAASIHNLTQPMLLPGITISTSANRFRSGQTDADGQVRRHHLAAVWRGDLREPATKHPRLVAASSGATRPRALDDIWRRNESAASAHRTIGFGGGTFLCRPRFGIDPMACRELHDQSDQVGLLRRGHRGIWGPAYHPRTTVKPGRGFTPRCACGPRSPWSPPQ